MMTLPRSEQRRAELLALVCELELRVEDLRASIKEARCEIVGLEFALAEAKEAVPVEQQKPHRLDIAAAILQELSAEGLESASVADLAEWVERKPSQVSAALTRLSSAGKVELVAGTSDRYRLPVAVIEKQEAAE